MMQTTEQYTFSVMGQSYTIVSDEERSVVQQAVELVEDLMRQAASKTRGGEIHRVAVLTAIKLAHECNTLKKHAEEQEKLSMQVVDLIDRELVTHL